MFFFFFFFFFFPYVNTNIQKQTHQMTMEVICLMLGLEPRQVSDPQDLSVKFLDFWPVALSLLADPKQLLSDLETVSIIIFFFFSTFPPFFLPFFFVLTVHSSEQSSVHSSSQHFLFFSKCSTTKDIRKRM